MSREYAFLEPLLGASGPPSWGFLRAAGGSSMGLFTYSPLILRAPCSSGSVNRRFYRLFGFFWVAFSAKSLRAGSYP